MHGSMGEKRHTDGGGSLIMPVECVDDPLIDFSSISTIVCEGFVGTVQLISQAIVHLSIDGAILFGHPLEIHWQFVSDKLVTGFQGAKIGRPRHYERGGRRCACHCCSLINWS